MYIVLKQHLPICETLCRDFNFYFTLLFVQSNQTEGKHIEKLPPLNVVELIFLQPLNIEVLKFLNDKCNTII